MLNREQLNFLVQLCETQGINVPIKSARIAADVYEELQAQVKACETTPPPSG